MNFVYKPYGAIYHKLYIKALILEFVVNRSIGLVNKSCSIYTPWFVEIGHLTITFAASALYTYVLNSEGASYKRNVRLSIWL